MLPSYNFDPNIWNSQGNDQNQQSLFSTSIQNYNQLTQQLGAMQRQGGQPNADYGNNLYGPIGMGSMPWGNYSSRNGIPNNLSNVGQSEGRTLFIGNLAESMTVQALELAFRKYGKITQARHYGLVTFATEKEAIWAKAQTDSMMLEGREMRVSFGKYKNSPTEEVNKSPQQNRDIPIVSIPQLELREHDPPASSNGIKTIFVGNLTFTVTSEILEAFFKQFGEITSVRLMSDKHYGFVTFMTSEAAEAAKQYATGVNLDGRPLRINFGKV